MPAPAIRMVRDAATSGPIPTFAPLLGRPFLRVLESKDHWEILDSSGALDLTFALRIRGSVGSECQIRSTRWLAGPAPSGRLRLHQRQIRRARLVVVELRVVAVE